MNVTREVIADLLPLYASGEASPATRVLVEAWLRDDPELRREAQALAVAPPTLAAPAPSPELELRSLHRTRRLLTRMRWSLAGAMFLTALTLTTEIHLKQGRLQSVRMLLFEHPVVFGMVLALAVAGWFHYFSLRRRLRYTAL